MARAKRLAIDRKSHVHGFGGKCTGLFLGLDLLFLGAIRTTEVARSLPMILPASFFWSFGSAPMALLACVIADSAPAYCVLMAFNSSMLEAFSIFAMPSATASGYRLGVEYRTFCHEIPFSFPVCFIAKRAISTFSDFTFFQHDST